MTGAPDREAIIDAVAREKPWRTPAYLVLFFLRRWAVVLFTLSFMVATRQHWAVAAIAIAGALWFDLKITPNALDLRLTDREFVRKIYDCEVFESDFERKSKKTLRATVMFIFLVFLLTMIGRIFVDYHKTIILNKFIFDVLLWFTSLLCIGFFSKYNPLSSTPNINLYNEKNITINSWVNHGYYVSGGFMSVPFVFNIIIILFCIGLYILGCIIFSQVRYLTINDIVIFWYFIIAGALGFSVSIIMNTNAKGQRIARNLVNRLQRGQAL